MSTSGPKNPYRIQFLPNAVEVDVNPSEFPMSGSGLSGSILDIAMAKDIDIDHACGGVTACATCHIIVRSGIQSCNEASDQENDQLDKAPGLTAQSRLACQCIPDGSQDLIIEIPTWNRNRVRE
jgi:2Fe-2S ferredoxin